jgi:sterol desaturase/sphingolipid hydroxylase (fatty acid hydroxylase superfamily)
MIYQTITMKNKIYNLIALCMILIISMNTSNAAGNMTMDSMTGGMSSDTKAFLLDLMFWVIGIGLIVSVIIAAVGFWTTNPTYTKWGIKGIVAMVIVVLLYYAATFAIAFVRTNYGS